MANLFTPPIPLRCRPAQVEGTVVVLGASMDQRPLIRTIRAKGLRALAIDSNPNSVAFPEADDFTTTSNRDVEAVVKYCQSYSRKYPIVGVTTMGSDIPHIVAAIAKALDLPSIPVETGQIATHKFRMKERFSEHGIPIPWFRYVDSAGELRRLAVEHDYRIIMKPVDASGSFGVFHPRPEDDLDELFARTAAVGKVGRVMVEEYLEGIQVSTQSVIVGEQGYTPGVAYRNYDEREMFRPQIMQNGSDQPGGFTEEQIKACGELTVAAGRALGITHGVAKGDLVIHPERGPMVIEIAARLSAGHFADGMIPVATGVNPLDAVVEIAVGCDPDPATFEPDRNQAAMTRFFFPEPGRLMQIEGIEAAIAKPWLKILESPLNPGDAVKAPIHHGTRAGIFLVEGDTREQARDRAQEVYETVKLITR